MTAVIPFGNTVDTIELEGRYVKEMLENSVAEYGNFDGRFLQMSGLCNIILKLLHTIQ